MEGAYLNRYVTDEQRSRRPIFIATLWAEASWLFFLRRGGSTRMTQIWALRSRLEKQPTDLRQNISYFGDRTLVAEPFVFALVVNVKAGLSSIGPMICPVGALQAFVFIFREPRSLA